MNPILKSQKLNSLSYDIRGPIMQQAMAMEAAGETIIKLNIGNVGAFAFDAPEEIREAIVSSLPAAASYSDSKGVIPARESVVNYVQSKGIKGVTVNDIYLGNGVSELILMTLNALLNSGDEVLVPAPDYPLWTAAVGLAGGTPRHYLCDETAGWMPDMDDIRSKITPQTKAIVLINPNNPTGAVYPDSVLLQILAVAREFGLIVFADEVYDKVLFDGVKHTSIASLADDVLILTFNGLSKNYRSCGYRAGWVVISGDKSRASDYLEGLEMLASMRLCANVPAQYAIKAALEGPQTINELVAPQGRLCRQRDIAHEMVTAIPGVSCVKPQGTMYMFPKLDPAVYPIKDDQAFALDFLKAEKVLLVHGTGFNWPDSDHFRLVFLPQEDLLTEAVTRLSRFLGRMRESA